VFSISRADSYEGYYGSAGFPDDTSLPDSTAVFVAYSTKALLTLLVLCIILVLIPPLLSLKRLPAGMTIPGCNSFAISAACHVSNISYAVRNRFVSDENTPRSSRSFSRRGSIRTTRYTAVEEEEEEDWIEDPKSANDLTPYYHQSEIDIYISDQKKEKKQTMFSKLAQSKLRWGVVKMPPEWYEEYRFEGHPVGHLSFGVEEDDVYPPIEGDLYA